MINTIITFWFKDAGPEKWFIKDASFDQVIMARFRGVYQDARAGKCDHWRDTAQGALALILVLDQFPRNMFRGDQESFVTDAKALETARQAIENGFDMSSDITATMRGFFYLPLQHSENPDDQQDCVRLAKERMKGDANYIDYAERHLNIIERFGRFPHRNAILNRVSTDAERDYLSTPGAGF